MAKLLMGKEVSARIKAELKTEVENLKKEGINPGLAVIIVGEDPASQVYVRNKERACEECVAYDRHVDRWFLVREPEYVGLAQRRGLVEPGEVERWRASVPC